MQLDHIYIKGFRNFKEATVRFNQHSLIIGANDVGKTNLIYAIQLLMDKGLSDYAYELKDSDFFAYEETNEVVIRLYFKDVKEDCVVARLGQFIDDVGNFVIQYKATKSGRETDYRFYCGRSDSDEDLKECAGPQFYRRYINIKYISSKRDLWNYINRSKQELLDRAKESRLPEIVKADDELYAAIDERLQFVDQNIPGLSYVKNATEQINTELDKLSIHNKEQRVVFDTASSDVDRMIANVSLASRHKNRNLILGGEGRINQIYLSLWASLNQPSELSNEVSIICIEEPEAYLHPHQQRELAAYLGSTLNGQVILTSHSPFIASEFSPNSIIRLYKSSDGATRAASEGCSKVIEDTFEDFGYRMSVIPAEAFFSDFAILVEGPSEKQFYRTLAKQLDIDLDRLNISVLSVDGVSFMTYIKILNALNIDWVLRTDNDILPIPKKTTYRYAGIERGLTFLKETYELTEEDCITIGKLKSVVHGFEKNPDIPKDVDESAQKLKDFLSGYNIFIAKNDLETDIYNSPLKEELKKHYGSEDGDEVIKTMKERKAENMYSFLKKKKEKLSLLAGDELALPLIRAKEHIEKHYGAY